MSRNVFPRLWLSLTVFCACTRPPVPDRTPVPPLPSETVPQPAPSLRPRSVSVEIRSAHQEPPPTRSHRLVGSWPREQFPRVSLEAHQEPVAEVIAHLAALARINLVLADGVSGLVTTRLREVPWTEALSAVCDLLDLVAVREGNVIQILRWTDWNRVLPPPAGP